jgi:hypothetical protein
MLTDQRDVEEEEEKREQIHRSSVHPHVPIQVDQIVHWYDRTAVAMVSL